MCWWVITFFVIFAILDVSLAVNLCINRGFLHLYHIMFNPPDRQYRTFVISYNAHTTQRTQLVKATVLTQNSILQIIFTLKLLKS